ncbi:PREDICTED: neuralized-like protein 2 [Ceratosolen solmsi marchali]|uniref:Neuralized-like protein 2 n=1 Tax=Ceratosolen solmsi marchali TaxID=326594 RepID=A0AAJ6YD92_9HYME|nr:PREDICTED: neuralized-like protein 2 [Ceratosolen solmsi marchali]
MTESTKRDKTRFHSSHGENIVLYDGNTVAYRKASFAKALVFSEEPLQLGEIFLLEIEKDERGWSGHMRIGLTQMDPITIDMAKLLDYDVALPNLLKTGSSWVFAMTESSNIWDGFEQILGTGYGDGIPAREKRLMTDGNNVHTSRGIIPYSILRPNIVGSSHNILPTDTGSRIGVMYVPQAGSDKAEMHFIINGEDQGVFGRDIPYKAGPLHVVVDVYGTTKQVRIIQLYGASLTLQSACRDTILQYTKKTGVESLPLPKMLKKYLLYQSQ